MSLPAASAADINMVIGAATEQHFIPPAGAAPPSAAPARALRHSNGPAERLDGMSSAKPPSQHLMR
jgi:hypothetical protein